MQIKFPLSLAFRLLLVCGTVFFFLQACLQEQKPDADRVQVSLRDELWPENGKVDSIRLELWTADGLTRSKVIYSGIPRKSAGSADFMVPVESGLPETYTLKIFGLKANQVVIALETSVAQGKGGLAVAVIDKISHPDTLVDTLPSKPNPIPTDTNPNPNPVVSKDTIHFLSDSLSVPVGAKNFRIETNGDSTWYSKGDYRLVVRDTSILNHQGNAVFSAKKMGKTQVLLNRVASGATKDSIWISVVSVGEVLAPVMASGTTASPTSLSKPTFKWRSSSPESSSGSYRLRLDGGAWDTLQSTEFTVVQDLAEGSHLFEVQEQGQNNLFSSSAIYPFLVDKTPPKVAIFSPAEGSTLTQKSPYIKVVWSVDGLIQSRDTLDTLTLPGKPNTLSRSAIDAAGNRGTTQAIVVWDTTTAPVTIASPQFATDNPKSPMANAKPTLKWISGAGADGTGHYRYRWDGGAWTEINATLVTPANPLSDGAHLFEIAEQSKTGHWSESKSVFLTIDTKPPVIDITKPVHKSYSNVKSGQVTLEWSVDGVKQASQNTANLTMANAWNDIQRTATDSAGNSGTATVQVFWDTTAPVVKIATPVNRSTTRNLSVAVAWTVDGVSRSDLTMETLTAGDGLKSIVRKVTDSAGNTGKDSIAVFLDQTKPANPSFQPVPGAYSQSGRPVWSWSNLADANNQFVFKLNSNDFSTGATNSKATSFQPATALSEGTHTLYLAEEDAVGNRSNIVSAAIFIDLNPPQLTVNGASPRTLSSASFTLDGTTQDLGGSGIDSVVISGAATGNGKATVTGPNWTKTGLTVNSGNTTLSLAAYDKSGRKTTITLPVTYTPPMMYTQTWKMTDTEMYHQNGAAQGDIWVVSGVEADNHHITYGPFVTLPKNTNYRADFRLAIVGSGTATDPVVRIDVMSASFPGEIIIQRDLVFSDFSGQDTFQTFSLNFSVGSADLEGIQFRVRFFYTNGTVKESSTTVTQIP